MAEALGFMGNEIEMWLLELLNLFMDGLVSEMKARVGNVGVEMSTDDI